MRLPWPFRQAQEPAPAGPASPSDAVAGDAGLTPARPATRAWADLAPIERTIADPPLVAPSRVFLEDVPGAQGLPPILRPLAHEVSPTAPSGSIVAPVRPVPALTSGRPMPPMAAPVQRRVEPVEGDVADDAWASGPAADAVPAPSPARSLGVVAADSIAHPPARPLTRSGTPRPASSGAPTPVVSRLASSPVPATPAATERPARAGSSTGSTGERPLAGRAPRRAGLGAPIPSVPALEDGRRGAVSPPVAPSGGPLAGPASGASGPDLSGALRMRPVMRSAPRPTAQREPAPGDPAVVSARDPGQGAPAAMPVPATTPALARPEPGAAETRAARPSVGGSSLERLPVLAPPRAHAPRTRPAAGTDAGVHVQRATRAGETTLYRPTVGTRPLLAHGATGPSHPNGEPSALAPAAMTGAPATAIQAGGSAPGPASWADLLAGAGGGLPSTGLPAGARGTDAGGPPAAQRTAVASPVASPVRRAVAARPAGGAPLAPAAVQRQPAGIPLPLPRPTATRTAPPTTASPAEAGFIGRPAVAVQAAVAPGSVPTPVRTAPSGPPPVMATPVVQRIDGSAPPPPDDRAAHSEDELEELARALYGRFRNRLRSDLIHEREARGRTFDHL